MNTIARIATVCQGNRLFPTVEKNRDHVFAQLDLALAQKPDLVCLPEEFPMASVAGTAPERAETVPGPTIDAVAERARRHNCYIVCPLLTLREGRVYNSAVVVGRSGEIVGIYDKRRPVTSSCDYTVLEQGMTPGTSDGIFDLDFGRIGIRICFDIGFPEDWELLAREGVRLVLWPSAYNGGRRLAAYALLHHAYIVTSVRTDRSRIIDPLGTTLAETDRLMNVAVRDISLDFAVGHYDFNFSVPDRILARYGDRVEIRSLEDDGLFLVEPKDPAVTLAHLTEEFGFESVQQYYNRHRTAYAALADGGAPAAQHAAHGDRRMYGK